MNRGRNVSSGTGGRTQQLEEEAAVMERKLTALKEAMAKEKEKRESIKAKAPSGGFWRASSKGTADVRKGKPTRSAKEGARIGDGDSGRVASNKLGSARLGSGRQAPKPSPRPAPTQRPPPTQRPLEANITVQKQKISRTPNGGPERETGMACGTEDMEEGKKQSGGGQFDGRFDEAANRREFLEALAAWRGAGKTGSSPASAASSSGGGGAVGEQSQASVSAACIETQTGTDSPPARAANQKPVKPYFDKLMMEAHARAAGEQAAAQMGSRRQLLTDQKGIAPPVVTALNEVM